MAASRKTMKKPAAATATAPRSAAGRTRAAASVAPRSAAARTRAAASVAPRSAAGRTRAAASVAPRSAAAVAPPDWRGRLVTDIRRLVEEADPGIEEALKWRGATTWSHDGLVCLANTFKDTVKVVFARGAKLADPDGLFNSELAGNAWRGITLAEKDRLDGPAFKRLVRSAVALNRTTKPSRRSSG